MCSFNWDILSFLTFFSLCIMPEFLYAQNTCPEISQQLLKDGFHRDLLIRVDFGIADEGLKSCKLAIKVHLPRGLYVDPYELKSLQQHNLTEALVITDEVDLEVPEYLATDSSVLIYMRPDPKCITCFKALLPLHCRYYSPSESDGKILVVLQSPEIMIELKNLRILDHIISGSPRHPQCICATYPIFFIHANTAFTNTLWGNAAHRCPSTHNSTAKSQFCAASRLSPAPSSSRLPSFCPSRSSQRLKPPARLRLFLSRAVTTRSDSAYSRGRPVGPPRHYRRPRPAPSGQAGSEKLGCCPLSLGGVVAEGSS